MKKIKVVLELTDNPLECCNPFSETCIVHPISNALRHAGHRGLSKKIVDEYTEIIDCTKLCGSLVKKGFAKKHGYMYFSEFFQIAKKYVDLVMSDEFLNYAQDRDDERRIEWNGIPDYQK